MPAATWRIPIGTEHTSAAWDPPADDSADRVFVFAHGAGGRMDDRSVLAMSDALRARGTGIVRFNFPYRERGAGRPDPMPRLITCLEAVVAHVRATLKPNVLVTGGRSMGGRAASMFASQGANSDGLLLLAYPLHPPGQTSKLRADHLAAIQVPVLCINGTRDDFCQKPLMEQVLTGVGSNWRMHWLGDADHSFHVLKRSGRSNADVLTEAADTASAWIGALPARH
jgi:uncharacterized protein